MPELYSDLPTPAPLLDVDKVEDNIRRMQDLCNRHRIGLRPHIKTHKMIEVGRRQLAAGALGFTCAKIGEAEAMLPTGVQEIFIAHALVDANQAGRLRALGDKLKTLYLACTSSAHFPFLEKVVAAVGRRLPIIMAIDTGLHREGARSKEEAVRLAGMIRKSPLMELRGIYTHEGQVGGAPSIPEATRAVHAYLMEVNAAIGGVPEIWPGSSPSARDMAPLPGITAIRPGQYVLGDAPMVYLKHLLEWDQVAFSILCTVVDRPEPGLAIIDGGSKTFSSDRTAAGIFAVDAGQKWPVTKVNEEHGYILCENANQLSVGQRVPFMSAHVCPTVNLHDYVTVVRQGKVIDRWKVDGRGRIT